VTTLEQFARKANEITNSSMTGSESAHGIKMNGTAAAGATTRMIGTRLPTRRFRRSEKWPMSGWTITPRTLSMPITSPMRPAEVR
jgi:hypothetical protein